MSVPAPAGIPAAGEQAHGAPGLRRVASRWEIVAFSLNDVVGSGVYLLPAAAAALLGGASVWAVVAAGFAVALLVLCFAEVSSRFDGAGGAYLYARAAFGELIGFEVGWMTWLARVSSVASLSVGFAQAISWLWPAAGEGAGRAAAIAVPLLALTWINLVGVKSGVRTAVFLTIAKLTPLLVFLAAGIPAALGSPWPAGAATPPIEWRNLGQAALLLMFAYAGFENTAAPAGEFKNPRRDVPFALLAQMAIVTLLYTAVQWVALAILPAVASSQTPLADAARLVLGAPGGWLLTIGGALSILGTNGNTVLSGPRYLYALASDGFGPRVLAAIHPRWRTPWVAILLQTAIALPLALAGSFTGLAALSVVARLSTYVATAAAVPVLRRTMPDVPTAVRLPGGPLIPVMAILICLGLAASATWKNLLAGALALLVGLLIWAGRKLWDLLTSPR